MDNVGLRAAIIAGGAATTAAGSWLIWTGDQAPFAHGTSPGRITAREAGATVGNLAYAVGAVGTLWTLGLGAMLCAVPGARGLGIGLTAASASLGVQYIAKELRDN